MNHIIKVAPNSYLKFYCKSVTLGYHLAVIRDETELGKIINSVEPVGAAWIALTNAFEFFPIIGLKIFSRADTIFSLKIFSLKTFFHLTEDQIFLGVLRYSLEVHEMGAARFFK